MIQKSHLSILYQLEVESKSYFKVLLFLNNFPSLQGNKQILRTKCIFILISHSNDYT